MQGFEAFVGCQVSTYHDYEQLVSVTIQLQDTHNETSLALIMCFQQLSYNSVDTVAT